MQGRAYVSGAITFSLFCQFRHHSQSIHFKVFKQMAATTGKATFKGSCHCGFVSYTVALDPNMRTASRCNCTWCTKPCFTNVQATREAFTLISPSSLDELSNYNPKGSGVKRLFCAQCGTHVLREVSLRFLAVQAQPSPVGFSGDCGLSQEIIWSDFD